MQAKKMKLKIKSYFASIGLNRFDKHPGSIPASWRYVALGVSACVLGGIVGFVMGNRTSPDSLYLHGMEKIESAHYADGIRELELGKVGSVSVKNGDFVYEVVPGGETLYYSSLASMEIGERNLLIKKLLLRRLAVKHGISEGVYGDTDALLYIIPRLERVLEDYYYEKAIDKKKIEAGLEKFRLPEAELQALARRNSGKYSSQELDLGQKVILQRLLKQQIDQKRVQIMQNLLEQEGGIKVMVPDTSENGR